MVSKGIASLLHKAYQHYQMSSIGVAAGKIASALNKIIQNSCFKKQVSLEDQKAQKEDRFLRGRQIAHMIYDYFESLALMTPFSIMLIYSITLRNDMFRNSMRDGTKFFVKDKDSIRWYCGKSVHIKNT